MTYTVVRPLEKIRSDCNSFNTAYACGEGHSEQLLGRIVREYPGKKLYTAIKTLRTGLIDSVRSDTRFSPPHD